MFIKDAPKQIASSSIFLFIGSCAAMAQDKLPWTGIYGGIHAGTGWGNTDVDAGIYGSGSFETQGPLIGGQLGTNWQLNDLIVLGLESDVSFSDIEGDAIFSHKFATKHVTSELDTFGTTRARAGILVTPSTLIYGTGGLAWGDWSETVNNTGWSHVEWGWSAGGGIETKLSDTISAKAEYIYMDFPSATHTFDGTDFIFDHQINTMRLGVNYKFW